MISRFYVSNRAAITSYYVHRCTNKTLSKDTSQLFVDESQILYSFNVYRRKLLGLFIQFYSSFNKNLLSNRMKILS